MFYHVIYIYVRLCQILRVGLSVTALQRIQLRPSIPPIKLSAPARSWQKLQNHSEDVLFHFVSRKGDALEHE